jgi:hypothetical protein
VANKFEKTIDDAPGEFTVTCRSAPYGPDKKRVWMRVGNYATLREAEEAIKRDKASMGETFGGLMAPTPVKGREYAIWIAKWERFK